ncbi:MAG: TIGR01459 family HAD-type hydrolase [Pseudomonadota bacterium]
MTQIIDRLADIAGHYDALLCDLWGCVHNGVAVFDEAATALQAFRKAGGAVLLLTNAPRPRAEVAAQIKGMGMPDDGWDVIATSGDAARTAMFEGAVGSKVWFVGEPRDHSFFEPLQLLDHPMEISRVPLEEAEGIVCTGPFDPLAEPETLRPQLLLAKTNGLKLLCANPDLIVDRGETREYCAGAIAKLYTEMGGGSLFFGKPHPPIYDLARRRLAQLGRPTPDSRILAIGDGIATDISGGLGEGIDTLFVTGGLARAETGTDRQPDPEQMRAFTDKAQLSPTFAIGYLR